MGTMLLLAGCGAMVNVDYDQQANFQALRTFTLMPTPVTKTGDERLDSPLVDQRIREAIVAWLSGDERQPGFCRSLSAGDSQRDG